MLSKKMLDRLNHQINRELYSSYFYMGMAAYASSIGLNGLTNWFNLQAKEEEYHAGRIFNYIAKNKGRVLLRAIEEPPQNFKSPEDLFQRTLDHEKKVTGMINDLVKLSKKENDKATESFLQWFVNEQKEEEESAAKNLKLLSSVDDDETLQKVDNALGKRR